MSQSLRDQFYILRRNLFRKYGVKYFLMKKRKLIKLSTAGKIIELNDVYHANKKLIQKNNCQVADIQTLTKYKNSDRVYIIGSGASINDITEEQWNKISKHDSFGFNFSFAHDFVPTLHHFELNPKNYDTTKAAYLLKSNRFKEVPILFNITHVDKSWDLKKIAFAPNTLYSCPRRSYGLEAELEAILKLSYLETDYVNDNFYLHYRASVSVLIGLSVMMGYKEIVLLGIDMYNHDYFYFDKDKHPNPSAEILRNHVKMVLKNRGIDHQSNQTHLSVVEGIYGSELTIDKYIMLFKKVVLDPKGIKLEI